MIVNRLLRNVYSITNLIKSMYILVFDTVLLRMAIVCIIYT